ncbi:hypothetical protein BDE36_2587 [Arcticibacter tournemirensis]|nr:hypothetical protein BDE36_2587 [Arcticibacter tournemirensis]
MLVLVFPVLLRAEKPVEESSIIASLQDKKKQDKKNDKKKDKGDQKPDQPEVKEVPKSRKQERPTVVPKPDVKVKPVKVNRPKIKKR